MIRGKRRRPPSPHLTSSLGYHHPIAAMTRSILPRITALATALALSLVQAGLAPKTSLVHPMGPPNLTCYFCSTLTSGDECTRMAGPTNATNGPGSVDGIAGLRTTMMRKTVPNNLQRTCASHERYCTVIRLDYSLEGGEKLLWSVERNCSTECHEGCIVLGERTKLYLCQSCCNTSLCNYDNGAAATLFPPRRTEMLLLVAAAFALTRIFSPSLS